MPKAKKKTNLKVSTTLFPADSFGIPVFNPLPNIKQELETADDGSGTDCVICSSDPEITIVDEIKPEKAMGYTTDVEMPEESNSKDKHSSLKTVTDSYPETHIFEPQGFQAFSELEKDHDSLYLRHLPKKEKFSLELSKYFNVNCPVSLHDINGCLDFLKKKFSSLDHLKISSAVPKVIHVEKGASCSFNNISHSKNLSLKSSNTNAQSLHPEKIIGIKDNLSRSHLSNPFLISEKKLNSVEGDKEIIEKILSVKKEPNVQVKTETKETNKRKLEENNDSSSSLISNVKYQLYNSKKPNISSNICVSSSKNDSHITSTSELNPKTHNENIRFKQEKLEQNSKTNKRQLQQDDKSKNQLSIHESTNVYANRNLPADKIAVVSNNTSVPKCGNPKQNIKITMKNKTCDTDAKGNKPYESSNNVLLTENVSQICNPEMPNIPVSGCNVVDNKRKPEAISQNSILPSKKIKNDYCSSDVLNSSPRNSIPQSIKNAQLSQNPHLSQSCFPNVRDPRLAKNVNFQSKQPNSKTSDTNITFQSHSELPEFMPESFEMPFCLLDWDPKWLDTKYDFPPILGNFKPLEVKEFYKNKAEYSKTYCSIQLLCIWQLIQNSYKCQKTPNKYDCEVQNVEEVRSYFKNELIALMPFSDMPKYSSMVLITWKFGGVIKKFFGYVYETKATPTHRSSQDSVNSGSEDREQHKINFSCYTTQRIECFKRDHVIIQKLCRVRVQLKQYEALCLSQNFDLMMYIINPCLHVEKIKAAVLQNNSHEPLTKFLKEWKESNVAITLIPKQNINETLIILTLVRNLMTCSTILICMRDMNKFLEIAKKLTIRCVLAVKESEVSIPKEIQQYTVRSYAKALCKGRHVTQDKAELDVLKQNKIILTLISNMYFSDTSEPVLGSNLICIIDDAHKCTEADTSLPLSFNPANVFLLGDTSQFPRLDSRLQKFQYQKTLFHRLANSIKLKIN